jgi:hypothetical protein
MDSAPWSYLVSGSIYKCEMYVNCKNFFFLFNVQIYYKDGSFTSSNNSKNTVMKSVKEGSKWRCRFKYSLLDSRTAG